LPVKVDRDEIKALSVHGNSVKRSEGRRAKKMKRKKC